MGNFHLEIIYIKKKLLSIASNYLHEPKKLKGSFHWLTTDMIFFNKKKEKSTNENQLQKIEENKKVVVEAILSTKREALVISTDANFDHTYI